jgi:serine/threonine protein kinase
MDYKEKYSVTRCIDRGTECRLLIAESPDGKETIAVKSYYEYGYNQAIHFKASMLMDHPNIVKAIGCYYNDDRIELLMEYIEGLNLLDITADVGIGKRQNYKNIENFISLVTLQTMKGLDYLHSNGLVHCDVKPENIVLSIQGIVKIVDFGHVHRIGDIPKTVSGTLPYLPYENAFGGPYTFATDIWSYGVSILTMLTLYPPAHYFRIEFDNLTDYLSNVKKANLKVLHMIVQSKKYSSHIVDFVRLCLSLKDVRPSAKVLLQVNTLFLIHLARFSISK